jgi:hypothetical protein
VTWGEFKRQVDRQVIDGNGDDEEVRSIDWNGLEPPLVVFQTIRRGPETQSAVYVN